ncbi:PAS domain-containing sensor histidine kinase [Siccirubricoccus deserti]|uniref:histidine kinase n=1 Tax=Siccirubricoccus deserti TaxID=2013562 RepID=A0A9X0UJ60_9PROT|nr:HWE histidine kinase domain-containing protein [Siccirubricoccus deserti]MBC4017770.1 PAS domain S-box protein [Siccirubricoccus deserti]
MELEAEVATLRKALARTGLLADGGGACRAGELGEEWARGAAEMKPAHEMASEEARLGQKTAADNERLPQDIAAQAGSCTALLRREEQSGVILDSAADYAIFTTDLDRRVMSWNAGAERLLGWTAEEMVGRTADIIFIPEDRARGEPERAAGGALAEGRAEDERWCQRKDGSRFWGSGLVLLLRERAADPGAPPLGFLKVIRNQTERRRAEEALRESEARWRRIFEHMHEGFALCEMVWSADGTPIDLRFLDVNPAWERLTGIPAAATLGHLATKIFSGIEDIWISTYARVVETGEPAHFVRYLGPVARWFEVLAYRTEPGRFAALFLNVTERRAAEVRRDALVELGDRLRDLRDSAEIAGTAAEVIGRALGVARAGYGTVNASRKIFRVERDWADGQVASSAGDWRLGDFWTGFAEELGRGEVVAVDDVAQDPRTEGSSDSYLARGVQSFLKVPVVAEGRVAAILYLQDTVPRRWSAEEIVFVRGAAERAWALAERARAEERGRLLLNELNHRVKNTLAVVQSIALQTARGAADLPSFSGAFQARLIALARAHDLLMREHWEGAVLNAVIRAALDPFALDAAQVDLSGCASDVALPPAAALALAMAMHELATNARKHGAFSVPEGRVSILCHGVDHGDGALVVEWTERGGPRVDGPPARRGFGLRLLERGLATKTGVGADIRFEPEGVRCTLRLAPLPVDSQT